jgi:hypothetical protein
MYLGERNMDFRPEEYFKSPVYCNYLKTIMPLKVDEEACVYITVDGSDRPNVRTIEEYKKNPYMDNYYRKIQVNIDWFKSTDSQYVFIVESDSGNEKIYGVFDKYDDAYNCALDIFINLDNKRDLIISKWRKSKYEIYKGLSQKEKSVMNTVDGIEAFVILNSSGNGGANYYFYGADENNFSDGWTEKEKLNAMEPWEKRLKYPSVFRDRIFLYKYPKTGKFVVGRCEYFETGEEDNLLEVYDFTPDFECIDTLIHFDFKQEIAIPITRECINQCRLMSKVVKAIKNDGKVKTGVIDKLRGKTDISLEDINAYHQDIEKYCCEYLGKL